MSAAGQRAPRCSWESCTFPGTSSLHVSTTAARSGLWPGALLTFSTSVGLAIAEEITPETTPQITLISNVSSAIKKKKSQTLKIQRAGGCRGCTE